MYVHIASFYVCSTFQNPRSHFFFRRNVGGPLKGPEIEFRPPTLCRTVAQLRKENWKLKTEAILLGHRFFFADSSWKDMWSHASAGRHFGYGCVGAPELLNFRMAWGDATTIVLPHLDRDDPIRKRKKKKRGKCFCCLHLALKREEQERTLSWDLQGRLWQFAKVNLQCKILYGTLN